MIVETGLLVNMRRIRAQSEVKHEDGYKWIPAEYEYVSNVKSFSEALKAIYDFYANVYGSQEIKKTDGIEGFILEILRLKMIEKMITDGYLIEQDIFELAKLLNTAPSEQRPSENFALMLRGELIRYSAMQFTRKRE